MLLVTASFGEGHNSAANRLAAALQAEDPAVRVSVHDVFYEAYGWLNRLVCWMYLVAINRIPFVWKIAFFVLDRTSVVGGGIGVFGRAARRLGELVEGLRPDVIVSTYPGYGHLLDYVTRRKGVHRVRLVTVVTDSLTINSVWFRPRTDHFLVTNEPTAEAMRRAGVPAEKIHVTGFPVPPVFAELDKRVDGPPWRVLCMVNSDHHRAAALVRELARVPGIELTVTAGRDSALERELESLRRELGAAFEIFGWTPRMAELIRRSHLIISKAGGATVQEAMAARVPMILTKIVPGQEEGNARLLLDAGAAVLRTKPAAVAREVEEVFSANAAVYRRMYAATEKLSHPNASAVAARFLLSLGG